MRYFRRVNTTPTFLLSSPSWEGETRQTGGRVSSAELRVFPNIETGDGVSRWSSPNVVLGPQGPSVRSGYSRIAFSRPDAASHEFTHLFVDENLRFAVPTLAALTLGTPARLGFHSRVMHDDTLSADSSPLVQRAVKSGVLARNPQNRNASVTGGPFSQRNIVPVDTYRHILSGGDPDDKWEEISHDELHEARSRIRQFLSGNPRTGQ